MRLADYIAQFLKDRGVTDIFMLTGYGSMYMNDAIQMSGIRHFATRNESTAPIMAESYARIKQSLGVVCVTAGPGATNAVSGLAEAWVDSAPIMILSGQVVRSHTTYAAGIPGLRTFGTAEINIIPIASPMTKFASVIDDPQKVRFFLEKAYYMATTGRPGPVWLDVPLDVQQHDIDPKSLPAFVPEPEKTSSIDTDVIFSLLQESKSPLLICGQGVRQSHAIQDMLEFIKYFDIPVLFSRLGQDMVPWSHPNVFGHAGTKGIPSCKYIMQNADLVISVGCRLAVPFVGHQFEAFSKESKIVVVDIDEAELQKPGVPIDVAFHSDAGHFFRSVILDAKHISLPRYDVWMKQCREWHQSYPVIIPDDNPIDLYKFMHVLGEMSDKQHIFVTDAGSNYYIGGQVWDFNKGQREITSGAYAAMGTTIPLAIGAAIAAPNKQILAITGDGSLELNIQELKTISHYDLNIKLFVINNGGYVSMNRWQDTFFDGRRLDTSEQTGVGTLHMKKISDAFGLRYLRIDAVDDIEDKIKKVLSDDKPIFVEVITDNNQSIVNAF